MSERGVFAVDRGIFTDPDFAKEPFTEREAFLWLVSEAAWKTRKIRVGATVHEIRRGQVCHSIRFMAEAWQWSKSRVDRYLKRLEKRDTIKCESGTALTTVTICKYDAFQRVSLPERDSSGTETGTAAGQRRDRLEDIETIEGSIGNRPAPRAMARETFPRDAFDRFWSRYPHKIGEDATRLMFEQVRVSDRVLFDELMVGLDRYCRFKPADQRWCNPATFLRDGRWKDQPAGTGSHRGDEAPGLTQLASGDQSDGAPRSTRIAPDWSPDQEDIEAALAEGVPRRAIVSEAAAFRDRQLEDGNTSFDWHASWRRWCRNFKRFDGQRSLPLMSQAGSPGDQGLRRPSRDPPADRPTGQAARLLDLHAKLRGADHGTGTQSNDFVTIDQPSGGGDEDRGPARPPGGDPGPSEPLRRAAFEGGYDRGAAAALRRAKPA